MIHEHIAIRGILLAEEHQAYAELGFEFLFEFKAVVAVITIFDKDSFQLLLSFSVSGRSLYQSVNLGYRYLLLNHSPFLHIHNAILFIDLISDRCKDRFKLSQ